MKLLLAVANRVWRSARIGYTAVCVWLRYKLPRWWDRALRRDPDARDLSAIHERNAEQIFETAVRLRGLLIKMCQVIGTRSDFFPPAYVRILSKAQDRVPPREFEEIRAVVEEDFGKPLDALFSDFKRGRGEHIAATFDVERGDPRKFSMATPKLGESCFVRVWETAVTSERIIQDLDRWPKSIQAIVDNQGMVVEKKKAAGHRRARAYLGAMHPDAEKAQAIADSRFGGR